jgi:Zn-dependent peptidase ImmA (M78 family)
MHPAAPALDANGCRYWDQSVEDEANWLAGALLVSEEAALQVVRRGPSLQEAAAEYGTSVDMMRSAST